MSRLSNSGKGLRLNCNLVSQSAVISLERVTQSQCAEVQDCRLLTIVVTSTPSDEITFVVSANVFEGPLATPARLLARNFIRRTRQLGTSGCAAVAASFHRTQMTADDHLKVGQQWERLSRQHRHG
jgi:hypothetical protein